MGGDLGKSTLDNPVLKGPLVPPPLESFHGLLYLTWLPNLVLDLCFIFLLAVLFFARQNSAVVKCKSSPRWPGSVGLALYLTGCVILGELPNLSEPKPRL